MGLSRRPLVKGAVSLFIAGIFNRLIGTVYRVLLVRVAGEAVVGLFQMTLPVYRLAFVLATAGLPVAVAKLTADAIGDGQHEKAVRYGRRGMLLMVLTSIVTAVLLFSTSELWAGHLLTDTRTNLAVKILPVLLLPAAICSGLRGVLQGRERLTPIAISSLSEVISRVPLVLFLVTILAPYGPAAMTAGVAIGLAFGEIVSAGYLTLVIRKKGYLRRGGSPIWGSLRGLHRVKLKGHMPVVMPLAVMAAPMLLSGVINASLSMINVALIPRELMQTGISSADATMMYGRLFGMALPTLYMPMVAIHPIVQAVIPAIAKRLASGNSKAVAPLLMKSFGVTMLVSLVAAGLFSFFGEEVGRILYGVEGLGVLITPLAIAAPLVYIDHLCVGILYGLGRTGIALVNSVAGSIVRLHLITELVPNPELGIVGALWAIIADFVCTVVLHVIALIWLLPGKAGARG